MNLEKKKIKVNDEINNELRKQMGMMPGQEKMVRLLSKKSSLQLLV